MKYLADSDWIISHLKGVEVFSRKLEEYRNDGLALSVISVAELYEGFYGARNPEQDEAAFREFVSYDVRILPLDEEICLIFARERLRMRRAGTLIGDMDLFIAATALRHGLIVLTNNTEHIGRVNGLEIISIQQTGGG